MDKIVVECNITFATTNPIVNQPKIQCVHNYEENDMKQLNIELLKLANYLIQLFFQTGNKYSCTRTKIGKLLTIIAFYYAREGQILFNEIIYKYDGCGTAIREIMDSYDRDIYLQYEDNDNQQYISDELCDNDSTLDENIKEVVKKVFRHFGAYSAGQLGECINPIVNQPDVVNDNGQVCLDKIQDLSYDEFCDNDMYNKTLVKYLLG